MSEMVTLELPDDLADRAKAVAGAKNCRVEDAVLDWLRRGATEPEVSALDEAQLLNACQLQMADAEQAELSSLLARQRERDIDFPGHERLAALMDVYRRGLVWKARALAEAAKRGLALPPDSDVAT